MSVSTPLVLGIDIGTSGVKGAIWRADGRLLASRRASVTVSRPRPGWAEHDAERDWWGPLRRITTDLLGRDDTWRGQIACVGISGLCPVVVPMDNAGQPLRRAILYSIDSRAGAQLATLRDAVGADGAVRRSGQPLGPHNIVAKLMWLRANEPDLWARTSTVLGSTGYAVHRLTGARTIDHFSAADGGLGYRLDEREWDRDLLASQGIDASLLPDPQWPAEIAGTVSRSAAAATGLLSGTPVAVGTGDALADLMGLRADPAPGSGAILYGTSISTMVFAGSRSTAPGVVTVPGWRPDQLVHSAILSIGVGVLEWWGRAVGIPWDSGWADRVDRILAAVPPVPDGPLHLPYLAGRRHAATEPGGRRGQGALIGLGVQHDGPVMMRAIVEGLAHALRFELDGTEPIRELHAVGGGARCRSLLQAVSDICGFDQVLDHARDDAARGAAWLAALAAGLVERGSAGWARPADLVTPDPDASARHTENHARFRSAIALLDALE